MVHLGITCHDTPFGVLQTCNQKTVEIRQPKDPFVKPNEKPISYDWRNGVYIYESDSLVKDPIDGAWKKEADLLPRKEYHVPKASEVEGHIDWIE